MVTLTEQQQTDLQKAEAKYLYYQQKVKTETDPRRLDKWLEYQTAWRQGVAHVKAGYTFTSVSRWATDTAAGEVAHALQREEEAVIRLREEGFTEEQIARFKKTGEIPLKETMTIIDIPPGRVTPAPTPKERFYEAMGLAPTKDPFGISYFEKPDIKPTAIYAAEDLPKFEPFRQTWWESTKQAMGRVPTGFKMSAAGLITEIDPLKGISYVLDPFKKVGKQIGEEKVYISGEPYFGTIISEEYLQTKFKPFEDTKFEYAKMMQVTDPSLYERAGVRIPKYTPAAIEMSALVGASITPTGAALVSGYLVGRGMKQTVEAETVLGKGMGVAVMGLGFTGIGFTMRGLQTSITRGEIHEALTIKPEFKTGLRVDLGEGKVLDYFPEKYKFGGVDVMKESIAISKQLPIDKKLFALTGEGAIIARTTEYMTGRAVLYGAKIDLKGLGMGFPEATAGFQPSIAYGKIAKEMEFFVKFKTPAKVKGKIELFAPPEKFMVGGIAKQTQDKILSMGGELKGFQRRWATREGIEISPTKFKFDVEEITLLKVVKPTKERMTKFVKPADIKKTPLSKTFQEQVVKPSVKPISEKPIFETRPSQLSSQISQKLTQPMKSKLISKEGDLMLTKQFGAIAGIEKVSGAFADLSKLKSKQLQDDMQKGLGAISSGLRGKLLPREKLIPIQIISPKMRLKQLQEETSAGINLIRPRPRMETGMPTERLKFFYFPEFRMASFGGEAGKGAERRKQMTQYQPSLRAIALNIRATKIPKSYLRGMGAIMERPIVRVKRRKKK